MEVTAEEVNTIMKLITEANRDKNLELEFKVKGVSKQNFEELLKIIPTWDFFPKTWNEISSEDTIFKPLSSEKKLRDNVRLVKYAHFPEATTERKTVLQFLDLANYSIRVALAREETLPNSEKNGEIYIVRKKHRYCLKYKFMKYDLTQVESIFYEKAQTERHETTYEVEIEYIGNQSSIFPAPDQVLSEFMRHLHSILNIMQKSPFVCKNSEMNYISAQFLVLAKDKSGRIIEAKPATLQKNHLKLINSVPYAVTEKPDGVRKFLIFYNKIAYFINPKNMQITKTDICSELLHNTIIDGEFMEPWQAYLAFDIISFQGLQITDKPFSERYALLEKVKTNILSKHGQFFHFDVKPVFFATFKKSIFDLSRGILEKYDVPVYSELRKTSYPWNIDGLIFIPANEAYVPDKNAPLLKWKPQQYNTIDFFVFLTKTSGNIVSYELCNMCSFSEKDRLFSSAPLKKFPFFSEGIWNMETLLESGEEFKPNYVVEFNWNSEKKKFIPIRLRPDKMEARQFGNHIKIALDNWNSFKEPITRDVISGISTLNDDSEKTATTIGISEIANSIFSGNIINIPTPDDIQSVLLNSADDSRNSEKTKKRKTNSEETTKPKQLKKVKTNKNTQGNGFNAS